MSGINRSFYTFNIIEDKDILELTYKYLDKCEDSFQIPITGFLAVSVYMNTVDFSKPSIYHPDQLKDDTYALEFIKSNIHLERAINFVRTLGLIHCFHQDIKEVKFGVVANIYGNLIRMFKLWDNTYANIRVPQCKVNEFYKEAVVVVEENGSINVINDPDEVSIRLGYQVSTIINMDLERNEGFIERTGIKNESDFYFRFVSCDFSPELGDGVRFLPAFNDSPNHANEPIALRISKVAPNLCLICTVRIDTLRENIYGFARDMITNEQLYYRVSFSMQSKLKSSNGTIKESQKYKYSVIRDREENRRKRIRLIIAISDNE